MPKTKEAKKSKKAKSEVVGSLSTLRPHSRPTYIHRGWLFNPEAPQFGCAEGDWEKGYVSLLTDRSNTRLHERVLAIDASLSSTGIALIVPAVVVTGKIVPGPRGSRGGQPQPKLRGAERLVFFQLAIREILRVFRPGIVVIESQALGDHANNIASLGEQQGVIRAEIWNNFRSRAVEDCRFMQITPTQLKKFATGSGAAKKDVICAKVLEVFGIDYDFKKESDEADAFVLAQIAADTQSNLCSGIELLKDF